MLWFMAFFLGRFQDNLLLLVVVVAKERFHFGRIWWRWLCKNLIVSRRNPPGNSLGINWRIFASMHFLSPLAICAIIGRKSGFQLAPHYLWNECLKWVVNNAGQCSKDSVSLSSLHHQPARRRQVSGRNEWISKPIYLLRQPKEDPITLLWIYVFPVENQRGPGLELSEEDK